MKTLKEFLEEARYVSSGAFRISPSGRKVRRRIKIGDDDYSKEDDIDKDGDVDADDAKRVKMMQRESTQLEEAKVETKKYSWGTMKTVHHGADFSIPLHPEHHQAIHALKHDEEHKFKDETGRHWTAKRENDKVHFNSKDSMKTTVSHDSLKESHAPVAPAPHIHRINVTVSEPDHPAVSQRHELIQKFVRVTHHTDSKEDAVERGRKHFIKKGFKVHDAQHAGMVHEATKNDDVPFDGPYTKTPETVKDKSGAVHTMQSRVRHLARLALKQQAKKNNEK